MSRGEARNQAAKYFDKNCVVLVFIDANTTLAPDAVEIIIEDFEKHQLSFIIPKYLPRQEIVWITGK